VNFSGVISLGREEVGDTIGEDTLDNNVFVSSWKRNLSQVAI
jgi:hypothetical protein